jgi:hypothetical protein
MKKLTLLFALLCASVMGWADSYCSRVVTTNVNAVEFDVTVTVAKQNSTTLRVTLDSEHITEMAAGGCFQNWGNGGVWEDQDQAVSNFKEGWTHSDNVWYKDFVFSTYPASGTFTIYILFNNDVSAAPTGFTLSNIDVAADCSGGSSTPDPVPAVSPYCNTEIGHFADPSAAAASFILLSVGSDGAGHTIVNIKQDNAKNSAMFDYILANGKSVGQDVVTGGSDEMAIIFNTPTPDGDGNIKFELQWSTIDWTGRWLIQNITLPATATCASADPFPGTNAYCKYTDNEMRAGNANVALTWSTDASGNVVIDISDGDGATNSAFRNGGFENEGTFANTWKVYSGTNHSVVEDGDIYFNTGVLSNGNKRFTLTKKADLPADAVVAFFGHAFSWTNDQAPSAYTLNKWFAYDYGHSCPFLAAPTNVAIDGTKHITFDGVANAQTYTAYVYLDGIVKHHQVVSSGDELTFQPYTTGTYQVQVVADASGYPTSDPSEAYDWALTAPSIVVGNSEYCEYAIGSGNQAAAITWETNDDGNIVITLKETLGGGEDATQFRGANGMALANFQVGEARTGAGAYFNHTKSGKTITLSLKNSSIKPGLGEKIYYTDKVVEYVTSQNDNAYGNMTFEFTYGAKCSGQKHVTAAVNDNTRGSATVNGLAAVDVDPGTQVTCVATPAEGYEFVNWTVGGVEVATTATYQPTITETTTLTANFDYIRTAYCHYELLSNESAVQGKKLYMTVGAIGGGDYIIKFEGSAEAPFTGLQDANYVINHVTAKIDVDGQPKTGNDVPFTKANGRWNFDAAGYGKAWIVFSLEDGKTIDDIYVWANAIYLNTASGVLGYVDNNDRLKLFGMNAEKRHNIDWNATCADAEAPVFAKAEAEVLNESSVRLTIQASDNWEGLLTYTIAREATEPIISNHASGEEFTQDVTGLTAGTEYTFTVTVSDGVNNTNQNIVVTPVADAVKPVMGVASLESNTWNSAIINVAATDNKGVTAYYVVELDAEFVPTEGKITVEGLTAATPYTFNIKAKDAAGNISDNQAEVGFTTDAHELVPTTAAPVPTWPAEQVKSIYSDAYALATVGTPNYNAPWWNAPAINLLDISGDHFMDYDLANDGMIGWQFNQISVASMEKVHIDIYASAAGTVKIRPITDGDGALNDNRKTLTLAAQEWNSFDVDLAEFGAHDWSKLFQFAIEYWNAGGLTGEHISVDNVYFYRTTPPPADVAAPTDVTVNSTVAKFTSVTIKAQANDDSGVVHFKVLNGSDVLVADVEAVSGAEATIVVNGLAHSTAYNLSLIAYDEASHEAEPVAVAFSTNNAPAAAPVPTHDAKYVLSVYSNAYEPAVAASFNRSNWGSAPLALEEDYLLYSMSANVIVWGNNDGNAGHGNIDGLSGHTHGTTPGLDVSDMQYIHFDVWCDADNQLNTVNINDQTIAIPTTRTVAGEWVSFDVAISGVALADRQNLRWLKFHPFNTANCTAAIDNVYFWSYGATTNAAQGADAGGWATFAAPIKLAVPAGLTAYKASYQKTETEEILNLSQIDVIPAGAGVILKGTAGEDYLFAPSDAADPDMSDNVLVGCPTRTDVSSVRASKDIFCMRYSGSYDMTGFFLYEGQFVPAGKAYLPLDKISGPNSAPRHVRFVINDTQNATGVENTGTKAVEAVKFLENGQIYIRRGEAVYNIQGVRVK